jgi:hypothetical protein
MDDRLMNRTARYVTAFLTFSKARTSISRPAYARIRWRESPSLIGLSASQRAALLSTLLGVGSELGSTTGTGSNSDVITALRRGSSDSLNQTGQKVVQQNLDIQPTLTVRPGFPVRVIVNRDLVLELYKG